MNKKECPVDVSASSVGQLVEAFDAALGSPPFDVPSSETLSVGSSLVESLEALEERGDIVSLKDLTSVTSTLPILCAAVVEGSDAVCLPLFRMLVRCIACIASVATYPLQSTIDNALKLLSFKEDELFLLLRATDNITEERLLLFLDIPPAAYQQHTKGKQKQRNRSVVPKGSSHTTLPDSLLQLIFSTKFAANLQALLLEILSFDENFRFYVHDNSQLARALFRLYDRQLIKSLSAASLVASLGPEHLSSFVRAVEETHSYDVFGEKEVEVLCRSPRWPLIRSAIVAYNVRGQCIRSQYIVAALVCRVTLTSKASVVTLEETSESEYLVESLIANVLRKCKSLLEGVEGVMWSDQTWASDHSHWMVPMTKVFELVSSAPLTGTKELQQASNELRNLVVIKMESEGRVAVAPPPAVNKQSASKGSGKKKGAGGKAKSEASAAPPPPPPHLTEENFQCCANLLYNLEALMSTPTDVSLLALQKFLRLVEKQAKDPISAKSWYCLLRHAQLFGERFQTLKAPNVEAPLLSDLAKATKVTASATWVQPFVCSENASVIAWISKWTTNLLVEITTALQKASSVSTRLLAISLYERLSPSQLTDILAALHSAGCLGALRELLANPSGAAVDDSDILRQIDELMNFSRRKTEEEKIREDAASAARLLQKIDDDTALAQASEEAKMQSQQAQSNYLKRKEKIKSQLDREKTVKQVKLKAVEDAKKAERLKASLAAAKEHMKAEVERATKRRAQFLAYKQRCIVSFKTTAFLNSLRLPSSDVQRVLDGLALQKPDTYDDILEYVVTGSWGIPEDLLEEVEPDDEDDMDGGFWSHVLESRKAADPSDHSFHYRVRKFLDLFCYDTDPHEVPDCLPSISLMVAKKLVSVDMMEQSGFGTFEAVFHALQMKNLVLLCDGSAQLTRLGFRYHVPFYDPSGVLQGLIDAQKKKAIQLLLAARQHARSETDDADIVNDMMSDEEVSEEYEESDEAESDDTA